MLRASLGVRTSSGSTGAAALEIIAPSAKGVWIREISVYLAAATASTYGLGRPAAKGITPTTPVSLLSDQGSDTTISTATALAWGTGPTVPAAFLRRVGFPAVITSFVIWQFVNGLLIKPGESLVLWNLAANGVVDVNVIADE